MDLTPEQRRVVYTLGFCGLVSAADNWFVSPALPAIASALGVAASAATIVLTAFLVPYGPLQPVCGTLGDRFGRLRVLHVIVAGLAAGTFLCAVAPTLPLLVAARVVTGCFAAGIITDLMSWRAAFACFGVPALALLWRLPRPEAPAAEEGAAPAAPASEGDFLSRAARIFFGGHRAIFLVACTTGIVFLGVYGFMGTLLSERCGLGPTQAGLVMMLYGVICLAGGAVSGRIGAARGPRGVIYGGVASGLLAIATLVVVTATGAWQPELLAAGALGFGYILTHPTLVSLSMDADPAQTGLCTGLIGLGVFAGGGVGSALGGQLVALGGYDALWLAAGALLVAQLVLGGRAPARLARRAG